MIVRDILRGKQQELVTATVKMTIPHAMEILIKNRISCLPVVDKNLRLAGIISDKDIFRHIFDSLQSFRSSMVEDLMTKKVIVGLESDEIGYIASIMTTNRIRHVPIMRDERLFGLVSVGDIVKTRMMDMEVENRYLLQFIEGSYPR
ncbi:MAG: CBS domain-containing protein [candidate division Zixibacteria bacterium]|nr:CBS domain-containing protein [candidate division Zixibacteria bacterium]